MPLESALDGTYRRVFNCPWTGLPGEFRFRRLTDDERTWINDRAEGLAANYDIVNATVRGELLDAALEELLQRAHLSEAGPVFEYTPLWTGDDLRRNDQSEDAVGRGFPEYRTHIVKTIMATEFGVKFQPYIPDATDYHEWLGRAAKVSTVGPVVVPVRKTPSGRRVVARRRNRTRARAPAGDDSELADVARRRLAGVTA